MVTKVVPQYDMCEPEQNFFHNPLDQEMFQKVFYNQSYPLEQNMLKRHWQPNKKTQQNVSSFA